MGYTIATSVRADERSAPEPVRRPALRPWHAAVIGGAVAALATLPGLGTGTLWDNSETAYGEVAREILLAHDWVVMHFNGEPWFVQPPLYFWIAALFVKAFGLTACALRLPSALATIAMGAALGYATSTIAGFRAAIYASIILSTCLMQAVIGRLAIMDALLDLAVTIGILAFFRAFTGGRPLPATIGGAIAIGFGILAKGLVAIVVVAIVIVPWLVAERLLRARLSKPAPWLWAAAAGAVLAIVVPWFALLVGSAGAPALDRLIGHYTFGRYLGTIENQSGPLWYYVPVVILGFFPWIAYLPGAIANAWRAARASDGSMSGHLARLGLVWTIAPFAFFSFAQTKLPNYIALELPALALLVALWFDGVVAERGRRAILVATAAVPLAIAALAASIALFARDAHVVAGARAVIGNLEWMGAIVFTSSVIAFGLLVARRTALAPYAIGAGAVLMVLYTAIVAEPHAETFKPIPQLAAIVRAQERPGDVIAIVGVAGSNALLFYTRPPVDTLGDPDSVRRAVCAAKRLYLVTSKDRAERYGSYGRHRSVVAGVRNDVLLLYDGPSCP